MSNHLELSNVHFESKKISSLLFNLTQYSAKKSESEVSRVRVRIKMLNYYLHGFYVPKMQDCAF